MQSLDESLFLALNRGTANPFFDAIMPPLTNLHKQAFVWVILAVVLAAMLLTSGGRRRLAQNWQAMRRKRTLWIVLAMLLALGMSDLTSKRVFGAPFFRLRPCQRTITGEYGVPAVRLVGDCPGSRSFPSSHAASMATLATVFFAFTQGRRRWLWYLIPLVIGYSRIYLGYHYPSDVAGGWLWGLLIGGLTAAGVRSLLRRRPSDSETVKSEAVEGGAINDASPPLSE